MLRDEKSFKNTNINILNTTIYAHKIVTMVNVTLYVFYHKFVILKIIFGPYTLPGQHSRVDPVGESADEQAMKV